MLTRPNRAHKKHNAMHYEEKIVAGTYCYRHDSKGEWKPMSNEQLTKKITALQKEVKELKELAIYAAKDAGDFDADHA